MRPDAPTPAPLPRQTMLAFAGRWREWSPLCLMAMNGDRSTERYDGYRQRHHDRLTMLHVTLGIPMKIIVRYQMDDPRLRWQELQDRIKHYRVMREKMNPNKNRPVDRRRGGAN